MIHDNIIRSYCVDFEAETIVIKTIFYNHANAVVENTDIIFTGYLTHLFNNEVKDSIIFDITEYPLHLFLEREAELLKDNKNYGWPISYKTKNELVEFLQSYEYKVFEVDSSYGLYGWVLAKKMDVVIDEQPLH
jgi:hypothetical protein